MNPSGLWATLNFKEVNMKKSAKKLVFNTGLILFLLGLLSADSDALALPIILAAVGLILMKLTKEAI